MSFLLTDTIAAAASAPGPGERAVVRLSGDDALEVAGRIFQPDDAGDSSFPLVTDAAPRVPRRLCGSVTLAHVAVPLPVDAWVWPTGRSYTGQPSVELHCVSSPPLVEALLAELYSHGARPARAGEFTLRAFLAGRIDLLQAEAVLGVIDATDDQQLSAALSQLAGGISERIAASHEALLIDLADLEAGLDFVDEDIEFVDRRQMRARLADAEATLDALLKQSDERMHSGAQAGIVLAGLPNAGKSSLFNALAGEEAAIVSPVRGTTRDWLRAELAWNGRRIELRDTAGRDDLNDEVSASARSGTEERFVEADLVVWCTAADFSPAEEALDSREREQCQRIARQVLHVLTKSDLPDPHTSRSLPAVSSLTGEGIDELRALIEQRLEQRGQHLGELIGSTAARCRDSLRAARDAIRRALALVDANAGDELIAIELRFALEQTGHVAGQATTDDLLDRIFSRFCIGK